jgi:hypothetical protein
MRTVQIDTEEMEAIITIIEYLTDAEEEEDYNDREPEERENHIWASVVALRNWYHGECCD